MASTSKENASEKKEKKKETKEEIMERNAKKNMKEKERHEKLNDTIHEVAECTGTVALSFQEALDATENWLENKNIAMDQLRQEKRFRQMIINELEKRIKVAEQMKAYSDPNSCIRNQDLQQNYCGQPQFYDQNMAQPGFGGPLPPQNFSGQVPWHPAQLQPPTYPGHPVQNQVPRQPVVDQPQQGVQIGGQRDQTPQPAQELQAEVQPVADQASHVLTAADQPEVQPAYEQQGNADQPETSSSTSQPGAVSQGGQADVQVTSSAIQDQPQQQYYAPTDSQTYYPPQQRHFQCAQGIPTPPPARHPFNGQGPSTQAPQFYSSGASQHNQPIQSQQNQAQPITGRAHMAQPHQHLSVQSSNQFASAPNNNASALKTALQSPPLQSTPLQVVPSGQLYTPSPAISPFQQYYPGQNYSQQSHGAEYLQKTPVSHRRAVPAHQNHRFQPYNNPYSQNQQNPMAH